MAKKWQVWFSTNGLDEKGAFTSDSAARIKLVTLWLLCRSARQKIPKRKRAEITSQNPFHNVKEKAKLETLCLFCRSARKRILQ